MKDAIVVTAFDDDAIIGISTGYPFSYETAALKQVFLSSGRNPEEFFCFGESVLRKFYRGRGIGKQFFAKRENFLRSLNRYKYICFYTSTRPLDDPRRPAGYRPLGPFWSKQGFIEHPELTTTVSYQEIGDTRETPKTMVFWIKDL